MTTAETIRRLTVAKDSLWRIVSAHMAEVGHYCPCPACAAWNAVYEALPGPAEDRAREWKRIDEEARP